MPPLDFTPLTEALDAELTTILAPLAADEDVYGFAIFVPEDVGSACLVYTYGRESKLAGKTGTFALDARYSPIEWIDSLPPLDGSNDVLEQLVEQFSAECDAMSPEESDAANEVFLGDCARAALAAMKRHHDRGTFRSIWFRVLAMTDDEHPVLSEAFEALNADEVREEASPHFP